MKKNIRFAKLAHLLACRKQRAASRVSRALVLAATRGDEARVSSLLALGASVSPQHCVTFEDGDRIMLNPLMAAAVLGQAHSIRLLLPASDVAAVSDPSFRHRSGFVGAGYDALSFAIISRCSEAIDALIPSANMQSRDAHGLSALALAAMSRQPGAVRAMLEQGWPTDALSSCGNTALMQAVIGMRNGELDSDQGDNDDAECSETVKALLDFMDPSLVDARNLEGHTAFMLSIVHGSNASFDLLWTPASQAMITPEEHCGAMLAIRHNRPDLFARMLPFADLQREDENGWTCLELAARHCRLECLQAFLDAGIDIGARFSGGFNALMAIVSGSAILNDETPEFFAKRDADALLATALLAPVGTLSRDANDRGKTALMLAIVSAIDERSIHRAQMARLLLPYSELSDVDARGDNALFIAISHGSDEWLGAEGECPECPVQGPCPSGIYSGPAHACDLLFIELLDLIDLMCAPLAAKPALCGETALMRAALVGAPKEVVDVLLRHFDPRAWSPSRVAPFSTRATAAHIAIMHEHIAPLMAIASAMRPFEPVPAAHGFGPMPSIVEFALEQAKELMDCQRPGENTVLDALLALDWDGFEPSADFVILALASGHEKWALRSLDAVDPSILAGTPALCYAARMQGPSCLDRLIFLAEHGSWFCGLSPLGWAARSARPESLTRLLAAQRPPHGDWHGSSPLELIFGDAQPTEISPGLAERQAVCAEILLAAGLGGEVKAFHSALVHKNMAAAGALAAKAFSIEGLPALIDLVKSGGASMAKILADAGALNGVDRHGLDIFDCVFWRYKKTSMSFPEFHADILSLVDAFGIHSPMTGDPLSKRVNSLSGGGRAGPQALILALDIREEAEALRKSCASSLCPSRPPPRL